MSTISLPSERQIRHFFVADAIASETDIKAFLASASEGEMQIFTQEGAAITGALNGKDFYLAKRNNKGGISKTDFVTPKDITYLRGTKPVAKVGKSQIFSLAAAPAVGVEYQLVGKVHYGNSEENFITFWAGDRVKSGDTATTLLERVAKKMADNLAASINTAAKANSGNIAVTGAAAAGTVSIDSGTAGSVDSVKVAGVELLSAAVPFNTSLGQTAADVAANINANTSVYEATVSGSVVTIKSKLVGTSKNGLVVDTVATTLVVSNTDFSGGTDVIVAKANKYFTVQVVGGKIVITEKDWILDEFRVGLRTHDQLMFNFELQSGKEQDNIAKTGTAPTFAKGQGYQIIELERYLVGHRAEFETPDVTLSFGRQYDTEVASQYYVLDLKYFDTSRDSEKHSDKMLTIVSKSPAVLNTIGDKITLAGGPQWVDLV